DLCADPAPGAAGGEDRVRVAARVQLVARHSEHAGRARIDAEVTPFASVDVDDDRPTGKHCALAHARTSLGHAAARSCGAVPKPAHTAAMFTSTVFCR